MQVLLIGSGYMAREYLLVLANLKCEVIIVGRGEEKIATLKKEFPQFDFHVGGIAQYLETAHSLPSIAINTVNAHFLREVSLQLLAKGVKNLLIEKPGDFSIEGLQEIKASAEKHKANSFIAYNRRFYTSVKELKNQIAIDGGISSAHFEFTEWLHTIDTAIYDKESLSKWIVGNSSHVIDTVFSIIGYPKQLNAIVEGIGEIDWHPSGSIFVGSGLSINNVPFTYHSNWLSAGRWAIEISTNKRRFYLKPMEKLQVQNKGEVRINDFVIEDKVDQDFKPGLFALTEAFLLGKFENLVSIDDQILLSSFYHKIGNY